MEPKEKRSLTAIYTQNEWVHYLKFKPKKKGSIDIPCTRVAPPICAFFNEIHYHS